MLNKIKKVLEKIAEDEKTPPVEEVFIHFETAVLQIKDEDPELEEEKVQRRAVNILKQYYNKQIYGRGNPFTFLNFGVLFPPKDKNKILRDEILKSWEDPGKRAGMIRQGKIMFMTIGEDRVPVKSWDIKDTHTEKDGDRSIFVIDKGEPCDIGAGDIPIPRDYRSVIKYEGNEEGNENFQFTYALEPNWGMTLVGIGFFDGVKKIKNKETGEIEEVEKVLIKIIKNKKTGQTKIVSSDAFKTRVQIYGPLANPHSEHFLGKESIWFMPLKFNASESGRSNMLVQQIVGKGTFELGLKDINIEKLIKYLNTKVAKIYAVLLKKANQLKKKANDEEDESILKTAKEVLKSAKLFKPYQKEKKYIPFIDLVDIDDYHEQYAVQYKEDDDGELIVDRNKQGWDNTSFDAFALCRCMYSGFFSKKGKKPKMMLTDWSIPDTLFTGFVPILNTEIESGEVYVCLTTSRSDSVFDEASKKYVKDPEEATAFFKIKGIKLVKSLKSITKKYEAKLEGDM